MGLFSPPFLRKIGLLRETSCNEGRTEGKQWTAQEMVTQQHGNHVTLSGGKKVMQKLNFIQRIQCK